MAYTPAVPADARSGRSARVAALLLPGVVVAVAAGLRFASLGRQSYWYDESVTVELLHRSLGGMLYTLPHTESTPPLYYVIAWLWARLVGFGEVGLRSLSALLGTATAAVAYALGRRLVSRRAGAFAGLLVAFNPMLIWYSQEARSYALLGLLCGASALAFAHAVQRPTRRTLFAWALIASLALMTHYFAVFVVAAEAAWLLAAHARSWGARAAVAAVAAVGAALLPLALHDEGSGRTAWIARIPLAARFRVAATEVVTSEYNPPRLALALGWLLAGCAVVAVFVWLADHRERRGAVMPLALGAAGVAAPLTLAATRYDEFYFRNLIGAWILLAVAVGIVLSCRRAGIGGAAAAALACGVELASLAVVLDRPSLQRDDWRGAIRSFASVPRPLAVVVSPSYDRSPIEVYRPDARSLPPVGIRVAEIVYVGSLDGADAFRPPTPFRLVDRRRLQHLYLVRYRASTPRFVTANDIVRRSSIGDLAVLLVPS
jgi:hypothetical protein